MWSAEVVQNEKMDDTLASIHSKIMAQTLEVQKGSTLVQRENFDWIGFYCFTCKHKHYTIQTLVSRQTKISLFFWCDTLTC